MCICIYTRIHTYIHVYIYIDTYTYICIHNVCIYIYTCAYTCIHIYEQQRVPGVSVDFLWALGRLEVPLAQFLEANFETLRGELMPLAEDGLLTWTSKVPKWK